MEPAASSSDMTADVGPLREIPHALFRHMFPGLPLSTILQLCRSSRDCRHAARAAIPKKLDQLVASVSSGCSYCTSEQLAVLMQLLERFRGAYPVLTDLRVAHLIVARDGTITPGSSFMLVQFPDPSAPCIYIQVYGSEGRNSEEKKLVLVISLYKSMKESLDIVFTYLWNNASGRMAGRKINVSVESCEGLEVGQAMLLLFHRAWQADDLEIWAPMKSPCPCAAIILASRSAVWDRYDSKRLTWETSQEGPRLRLVGL